MNKPKILVRDTSSIKISWENVFTLQKYEPFIMEKFDELLNWTPVYWGCKTECTITGLHPCTCYTFRLKRVNDDKTDWLEFKAATDIEQYLIRHMTRAVRFNKTAMLKKMIQARSTLLECENADFKTPLMQAVELNDINMALLLINLGANVNAKTIHTRKTALMLAVFNQHLKIAKLLIEKGANISETDVNNLNILHYAVNSNKLESVKFALEQEIDINSKDSTGLTALLRAVILNIDDEIVEYLIDYGADYHIKDSRGFDYNKHCKISERFHLLKLVPRTKFSKVAEEVNTQVKSAEMVKKHFYIHQNKEELITDYEGKKDNNETQEC